MMNLGNVVINYNENGDVESATFKPAMQKDFDKRLLGELKSVSGSTEVNVVRHNAELVLAGWISLIVGVDEADMMYKHKIQSDVVECTKHESGLIKSCEMNFTLIDL